MAALNLDDIFSDVMFTPEGDTVFLSEEADADMLNSGENGDFKIVASKKTDAGFQAVNAGGGLDTTNLADPSKESLTMGEAAVKGVPTKQAVPFKEAPQKKNQLEYAAPKKKKKKGDKKSKEDAKKSKMRKKFLLESLQQSVGLLKEENEKLRNAIKSNLGADQAEKLFRQKGGGGDDGLAASTQGIANKVLDDPDFSFIKALQTAQQNFVVTDPSLPDNPIVYASQGFLNLTGYSLDQILGRNCRFLQGPETDPKAVEHIRKAIEQGNDMSVCLLNYRVDGTTFWNQFFIAALRDASGTVTNFVGVQCKVSDQYAATVTKQQEEEDAA